MYAPNVISLAGLEVSEKFGVCGVGGIGSKWLLTSTLVALSCFELS